MECELLGVPKTKPVSAERCLFRKLDGVSVDRRGVMGRLERSGFMTLSCPCGTESLYPSPAPGAKGLGQCRVFMRMIR